MSQHSERHLVALIAAAIAALALTLAPAGAAAAGGRLEPGPKVAPGVFLAEVPQGESAVRQPARSEAQQRIVGGTTTTIAQWPWQAAITKRQPPFSGDGRDRQFCGGSLVAPTIVITAAHCTFDVFDSNGAFDAASNFASITGRTTLSNSAEGQEIPWASYFVLTDGSGNPLYNPDTMEFDAVFARLASPSSSTPIAIAGADEAAAWAPGDENAFATGWGTTVSGVPASSSDTLRQVQLDILADSVCGSVTSYGSEFRPATMLCAGETVGGKDTCQGDSGGPLVVPVNGTFRLVGDTSFGNGCALPNFPGIYGRLAQDPMCSALRNGIQSVAGVDVVGPGGCLGAGAGAGAGGGDSPPETTITKSPKNKTKKKKASFAFTSSEPGSSFECSLDGKQQFKPCTSPLKLRVKKGRHNFQVQAIDAAGNADPTPASDKWKVKKKK